MTDQAKTESPRASQFEIGELSSLDTTRLSETFLELAAIKSPSREEREVADYVVSRLRSLGLQPEEDEAGLAIGGQAGNIWCLVSGKGALPAITLSAHIDTVKPVDDIVPVLEEGIFRNSRPTILGADDKAAVAALLCATELLLDRSDGFPTFTLCFTVSEETSLHGAKHAAPDRIRSPLAAVFDSNGPVGGITVKGPSQHSLRATFRGKAAHAGVSPEAGRSAIAAAAKAISLMALGRLDEETTANIGVIRGGTATNIVPDLCVVKGECRSHDEAKLARVSADMVRALQTGALESGVDVDVSVTREFKAYALGERTPIVRLSKAAISAVGLKPVLKSSNGGSDANVFNERGTPTVNLVCGMEQVHSPGEFIALKELVNLVRVITAMVQLAPRYIRVRD